MEDNMKKGLFAMLCLAVFAIVFVMVLGGGNQTSKALAGDVVTVNYILRDTSGNVLDTNIETIARNFKIYTTDITYQPFRLRLSPDNGMLPGFTNGIINMSTGMTKEVFLPSAEAYAFDPALIFEMPKSGIVPRVSEISITPDEFTALKIRKGANITNKKFGWKMTVVDIMPGNSTIVLMQNPEINQYFINDGWPTLVKNMTDSEIYLELTPDTNKTYLYQDPAVCPSGRAKVAAQDNLTITIDCNHPMAGKDLKFEITLLSIEGRNGTQAKTN